jgi:lysophospholipase L1-like esterase
MRTGWIYSVVLTLVVILLCLTAGEAALRHWFPLDTVILQPDNRYLYRFIPNSRQLNRPLTASGAPSVLVTINSQGRRGELLTAEQKVRIMVYGDSFIAAEGTPLQQTFVVQLEQLLSAKLPQVVHAINAGVPGYGPDQESLVMEDEIDSVHPSLIVFSIYSGNDFGDLVRNKLFKLDERGRLVPNHPVLDQNLVRGFEAARMQQPAFQTIRRVKSLFHVSQPPGSTPNLVDAWVKQSQKEYANAVVENDNDVHNLFEDGYDVDISTAPRSDSSRYKVALMARVMKRIQEIASKRSIPLVFLIIPSPIDVLDKWDLSIDGSQYPDYRRAALTAVLEGIAKEDNAWYLNLFEPFHSHQAEDLFYHALDDHWNARGERLAASLMADYIVRNELLRLALEPN